MAYVTKRGARKYTGYYRDVLGKRRSAGTFESRKEAMAAAVDAERYPSRIHAHSTEDRAYSDYVTSWLKADDEITLGTKRGYESAMKRWVLPLIGHLRVAEINPRVVEAMLAELSAAGVSAHMRQQCKAAVGSSFRPLVPEVVQYNPTHGVKVHLPPAKEFDLL